MNGKFIKLFIFIFLFPLLNTTAGKVILYSDNPSQEKTSGFNDLYKALIVNPMNIDARFTLAKELYNKGDYRASLNNLQYLISITDDDVILLFFNKVKYEYEEYVSREISRYMLLLESMPVNKGTAMLIYKNEKELGKFEHTTEVLTEYLRLDPNDLEVKKALVDVYLTGGLLEDAYSELQGINQKNPEDKESEYLMYKLAAVLKKYSKRYEDYFYSNPREESLIYLGIIEYSKDNVDATLDYLNAYDGKDNTHPDISKLLYLQQKNYKSELEIKGDLLQEARDALQFNDCAKSAALFAQYLDEYPADSTTLYEVAEANYCAENYKVAADYYTDYFNEFGSTDDLLRKRAHSYQESRQNFLALDDYLLLNEKFPDDEDILIGIARTYNQAGLYDVARTYYQKTADLYPTSFYILDEKDKVAPFNREVFAYIPHILGYSWDFQKKLELYPRYSLASDGEGFVKLKGGFYTEINLLRFLTLGTGIDRVSIENKSGGQNYTGVEGAFILSPLEFITLEAKFGMMLFGGNDSHFETNTKIDYHSEFIKGYISYFNGDASQIYNDEALVFNRIHAQEYSTGASIYFPRGMVLEGKYSLFETAEFEPDEKSILKVSDNIGNELTIIGKIRVFDEYFAGYQYFYADYKQVLEYYYTPQLLEQHSFIAETPFYYFEPVYVRFSGIFGIIPDNTLLVKGVSFELKGVLIKDLEIHASGNLNWNYRFTNPYSSRNLSIYLRYSIL